MFNINEPFYQVSSAKYTIDDAAKNKKTRPKKYHQKDQVEDRDSLASVTKFYPHVFENPDLLNVRPGIANAILETEAHKKSRLKFYKLTSQSTGVVCLEHNCILDCFTPSRPCCEHFICIKNVVPLTTASYQFVALNLNVDKTNGFYKVAPYEYTNCEQFFALNKFQTPITISTKNLQTASLHFLLDNLTPASFFLELESFCVLKFFEV